MTTKLKVGKISKKLSRGILIQQIECKHALILTFFSTVMFVYIHTCIYIYLYISICLSIYLSIHLSLYLSIYTNMYIIYTQMYI